MNSMAPEWREPSQPDVLFELTEGYGQILALLDRAAAMRRIVADVPSIAGVDVAWVGEPDGDDRIILGYAVNTWTDVVSGLVVPRGAGLGGQVMVRRRPLWVSDYGQAPSITHQFLPQAQTEGIGGMIAVPMVYEDQLLGVLYGANRHRSDFGDRTTEALEHAASRAAAAAVVAERARHAAEVAVHEERRRLALQLHDTVGAMLFTIGAGIRTLVNELPSEIAVRSRLDDLEDQAMQAAAALRGSLHALSASPEQVALGVALRSDCRAFEDRTGIVARLITITELPSLTHSRIKTLADATREALLNVEKHANARSVVVSVFAACGGVVVTIADDGVGLQDKRKTTGGLGLPAMSERLARVGGRANIIGNDDGGVTVQAWVPA
jgi:LuxR family transcriptional regulator, regulator of acetate metabolism